MHKYSEWFLRAGPKLRTKNKNNNNGTCLSSNPGNVPWKLQNDSVAWAWGHGPPISEDNESESHQGTDYVHYNNNSLCDECFCGWKETDEGGL